MKIEQLFYPGDLIRKNNNDDIVYVITRAYFQKGNRLFDDFVRYRAISTDGSTVITFSDNDFSDIKLIQKATRYYRVDDVVHVMGYLYNAALSRDNLVKVVVKGIELKNDILYFFVIDHFSTIPDNQKAIYLCCSISLEDMLESTRLYESISSCDKNKEDDDSYEKEENNECDNQDDDDDNDDNDGC